MQELIQTLRDYNVPTHVIQQVQRQIGIAEKLTKQIQYLKFLSQTELAALWINVIDQGIQLAFIEPQGVDIFETISPNETWEYVLKVPKPYTCTCWFMIPWTEEKGVVLDYIYKPKEATTDPTRLIKDEDWKERNCLVRYYMPTIEILQRIMYIPKYGVLYRLKGKYNVADARATIWQPFFKIHEDKAVNLYEGVFKPPHEFVTRIIEGKSLARVVEEVLEGAGKEA